ncbi:MAG TPA: type IV toxin-antitoxin system AbiEi family antitoxin domain-containing protein [Candidatus Onthovivens sp.]|nr:type IV toxin-antitoxin system AbiEi family antitoxin domain-containing protein [Candidatus Onthovivens sp.]
MLARKKQAKMDYQPKINKIINENFGIITTKDCLDNDIPSIYLTRMVSKNLLFRIQKGIYSINPNEYDDYYFFQFRFSKAIYSYQSSLFFHGLTDRVPFQKEITLYKGYNPHSIPKNVVVHFVNKDLYQIGISELKTQFGNSIKVYDKERTICDLIRNRKEVDVEIFRKAINGYFNSTDKNVFRLYRYAHTFKIEKEVNDILEVLYE